MAKFVILYYAFYDKPDTTNVWNCITISENYFFNGFY